MALKDKALEGKVALVTGGSRGIGRAIAVALGGRGAKVAINYMSNEAAAKETAEAVKAAGGEAVLAQFDVGNAEAATEGVTKIGKDEGQLDIVVNNAGVAVNGLLMRYSTEQWDKVIGVNLSGAFYCTKAAARYLLKAKAAGRVINLTSVVGEMGNGGQAGYAASKAGMMGLTKSLAKEFASRGVTVNAVAPGYIETDMTASELPEDQAAKLLEAIPHGRIGKPEEIADVVAFLAGPEASYVTGQVIRVNGGLLMA